MSHFHVTADESKQETAVSVNERAGLEEYGSVSADGLFVSTYEKRAISNENFLRFDDGDFVACTGAIIFDGALGGDALEAIYDTFLEGGAEAVRDQGFGHYAVAVKNGEELSVFGDPNGAYEIFYTQADGWFVSDSLGVTAQAKDELVVDRYNLFERCIEIDNISSNTFYRDIYRLYGTELLRVDLGSGEFDVEFLDTPPMDWNYEGSSLNDVLEDYHERVVRMFSQISAATDELAVQATGGLDSRTVLASAVDAGAEPAVMYGVATDTQIIHQEQQDLEAARQYAERFELPFYRMDWGGDFPYGTDVWDELLEKYGFEFTQYSASPEYFAAMEGEGIAEYPRLTMSGYAFGAFTNTPVWDFDDETPLCFEELVKSHFSSAKGINPWTFTCREDYLERVLENSNEYVESVDAVEYTDERLDLDEFVRTIQYLWGRTMTTYVNVGNRFNYHIAPFATYRLGRPLVDVPAAYRRDERIRIKLLKKLLPEILEVPVYSGLKPGRIDEDDRLVFPNRTRVISSLGRKLPASIMQFARPLYNRYTADRVPRDKNLLEKYDAYIRAEPLLRDCFSFERYWDDIRLPSRLALYSYAINSIGYDDVV